MALSGALITALWYPNRNAPKHAVPTETASAGPTFSHVSSGSDVAAGDASSSTSK